MRRFSLGLALAGFLLSACAAPASHTAANPIAAPDYETAPLDLSTPANTAYSMMMAMYRGDTDMVDAVFAEDGALLRLRPDGSITRDGLPRWREWVGTLDVGHAHEELFDIEVERYGKLATVWAPFTIRVGGELVGCGVNQFTMAEMEGDWRVVSGMDVQAPKEDCAGFRESYKNGS